MLNAAIDHNVRDSRPVSGDAARSCGSAVDSGKLRIVGARYDLDSGAVTLVPAVGERSTQN